MSKILDIESLGTLVDPQEVVVLDEETKILMYKELDNKIRCLKSLHYLPPDIEYKIEVSRTDECGSIVTKTSIRSKERQWQGTGKNRDTLYSFVDSLTNMELEAS